MFEGPLEFAGDRMKDERTAVTVVDDCTGSKMGFDFDALSPHAQLHIFSFLNIVDLASTRACCKYWKCLSDADVLWKRLYVQNFTHIAPFRPKKGWRSYFIDNIRCFQLSSKSTGLKVSSSGKLLVSTRDMQFWGTCTIGYPLIKKGVHYCEFLIESFLPGYLENTWKIVVGVVSKDFVCREGVYIGNEEDSYGYIAQNGYKVCCKDNYVVRSEYGNPYKQGDRVGVCVNMDRGTISMYLNGKGMGVAFENVIKANLEFRFAVSLAKSNMGVRVLPEACVPSGDLQELSTGRVVSVTDGEAYEGTFPLHKCSDSIVFQIFSHLNLDDLNCMRLTNKKYLRMTDSDVIWRPLVRDLFDSQMHNLRREKKILWRDLFYTHARRWSHRHLTRGLLVSCDGFSLKSSADVCFWATARVDYPVMTSGVHYLEFNIVSYRRGVIGNIWKIVCGVVSSDFEYKLARWIGVDGKSFGYIAHNGKKVGPKCVNQGSTYSEPYQEQDTIGILVDFELDQITFYKNGINLGVAFDKFSSCGNPRKNKSFHYAVCLARRGMTVRILPNAKCPDRDLRL